MLDETSAIHVAIIAEIARLLTQESVPFWLFGGWAVDFAVGHVTRPHRDIEWVIWGHDSDRVTRLLSARGYALRAREEEALTLVTQGIDVEFYVLVRDAHGCIITPGRWAQWPWLPGAFAGAAGRIGEVACPMISIETLLETKEGYAQQTGLPLRPHDHADIAWLRRLPRP